MKVIILAAGRGSRLEKLTEDRPKCMCRLAGKPLLERCLETLVQAGFSRSQIGIVTGYRRDCVQMEDVSYFHNPDWAETNMVCSLLTAQAWLRQEPCLVCYSDIVFTADPVRKLANCAAPVAVTYYTDFWQLWEQRMENPLDDLETFQVDGRGQLVQIGGKPAAKEDIQGQYMGLLRFTPTGWGQVLQTIQAPLPKPLKQLDMTTLLNCMLQQGYPIQTIPTNALWLECDTVQDIQLYEQLLADRSEMKGRKA